MERVTLPTFKIADASAKDISVKMDKVFGDELKSTLYQLSGGAKGGAPKSIFKTNDKLPLRPVERNRLALTMSTEEVMNTNQYVHYCICVCMCVFLSICIYLLSLPPSLAHTHTLLHHTPALTLRQVL